MRNKIIFSRTSQRWLRVGSLLLAGFLALLFINAREVDRRSEEPGFVEGKLLSPFDNKVYAVRIPQNLDFAGESVPLNDPDVRKRLDRELLVNAYWHSQTMLLLKEYDHIVNQVEPILKKHQIPSDFVFLCIAESGLQLTAQSPKGAAGLWQFVKPTAIKYGLVVNEQIDERLSLEKSTEAACRYLLDAKQKFGSWTMAAAAFNRGMEGLEAAVRNQKTNDYYQLYLNPETARYIYRILSLKVILRNPQQFGFLLDPNDKYPAPRYRTVHVDSSITSLPDFAAQHGTSYKTLRLLNPWLIGYSLTLRPGQTMEIRLPA